MSSNRQLSHDILNALERLRIMHDLIKDNNFKMISKNEIENDLQETLKKLQSDFAALINQ